MAEQPLIIEVDGLDELQEALKEFVDDWQPIANRALTPGLAILVSAVKKGARWDTGTARARVGSEITRTAGSEIIGKVGISGSDATEVPYGPYALEYGRLPGRMPPPDRLEEWAGRHGMVGAGFAIARAIAARGVKAPHTMSKVAKAKAGEVVKKFEEGIVRELRRLKLKE
ncbi:MAG TPA: hypothetical protein VMW79_10910 [Anaerolineae bacterium]|nr:hypothetical protein [Anaerolineae bacterium]